MKNYIFTKSSTLISLDEKDSSNFDVVRNAYSGIDWIFPIPEDGKFFFSKEKIYDVKAGDVVYVMYPVSSDHNGYDREIIINSSKELNDYYARYEAQKQKENNNRAVPNNDCEISA